MIRCDKADNGVRAKNNPTISAETICIPYSIALACATNTPRPYQSDAEARTGAVAEAVHAPKAASRDSTPESSAHAVAAPTGYPLMSPSTRSWWQPSGGRPYNRLSGFRQQRRCRWYHSGQAVRLTTKTGIKAGKACAAARESPSRTPSAQAVGQSKNAAKRASDKNSFIASPRNSV